MKLRYFKFFTLIFLFAPVISSFAQWNPNTSVNTLVSDETGEQSVQKLALCPDGSTYYSWFDNRGGSYAVYLQKLDVNGNAQFTPGGILISSNPQNSSLVDWDMIADNNNNCILTFTDIRSGGQINPFAYMVSPSGTQMWGANGIALSDSVNSFQPNPKVVQTSDGNYVFFWRIGTGPQKLALQKVNSAGVKQWGTSPVIWTSGTNENYDWPAIVPSDNGSVIVMFSGYTGSFISPANYRIYSQKVSSTGARVWNATQDTVYSLGRVSGFYTPRLFSDGNNGAVYCWHDDRNSVNLTTGYIQRKNSAGTVLFPVNGTAVSGNTTNNHFSPVAAYMPATGETYVAWQEANSGQTQWGFYAQKINSSGVRQWGDGIAIQSLGTDQVGLYTVMTRDSSAIICFNQSAPSNTNLIKASKLGPSGSYHWPGNIVTASSISSSKIRINSVINQTNGNSVLCWQDKRLDGGGIYAQNIKFDGTFGPLTGITTINSNIPANFSLMQNYPNPFNPVTKIRYSIKTSADVNITVYDILGNKVEQIVSNFQNAGTYETEFQAEHIASGIYIYRLSVETDDGSKLFTETKKMILIK